MNIYGYQKTTLLDYPGHVAATIFTGGCNFRCPFCHNASLVLPEQFTEPISEDHFFSFLNDTFVQYWHIVCEQVAQFHYCLRVQLAYS